MNQAGIDVSNETFDVQRRCGEVLSQRAFRNSPAGHRQAPKAHAFVWKRPAFIICSWHWRCTGRLASS